MVTWTSLRLMLFLGMISGIHASVVGDLPVKPGPISGQTFGYTSGEVLEFGPKSANELQFVSVRLEEQAEINSSTYGRVANARIFHTFESYEAGDPHPANFTAEANGAGVSMRIPLPEKKKRRFFTWELFLKRMRVIMYMPHS